LDCVTGQIFDLLHHHIEQRGRLDEGLPEFWRGWILRAGFLRRLADRDVSSHPAFPQCTYRHFERSRPDLSRKKIAPCRIGKVVDHAATPQPVRVEIAGLAGVEPKGQSIVLSAAGPDDTNSITEPTKIVPVTTSVDGVGSSFTREFPPYSITILELRGK
jgi:hypothetical protein